MAEDIVESKEEMKKRMRKIKKESKPVQTAGTTNEEKIKIETQKPMSQENLAKVEAPVHKTETRPSSIKVEEEKPKSEQIKTETKEKIDETKEDLKDVKEETQKGFEDLKTETQEGWEDVKTRTKSGLQDIKEETSARTERLKKESEMEGRNPAEKFLSDIISGFRQKTEDVNQAVGERGITPTNLPLTDVLETNDAITIISDIPGLSKEKIEIAITQNTVEITAHYNETPDITNATFIQKERGYGSVHRIINFNSQIDIKKASASYKNSNLIIKLPKRQKELTKIVIEE
jgi:HSP20 family protein